jgi:hypothetical protein
LIGIAVMIAVVVWIRSKRVDPYDLKRLNDPPYEDPGEAWDDMVTEESGPYCSGCDTPNPAGTNFCQSCGRKL